MPPKAGACQPRHGHERIGRKDYGPAALVLRSIKRRKVLMNLSHSTAAWHHFCRSMHTLALLAINDITSVFDSIMVPSFLWLFTHRFASDLLMDVAFPAYMS